MPPSAAIKTSQHPATRRQWRGYAKVAKRPTDKFELDFNAFDVRI